MNEFKNVQIDRDKYKIEVPLLENDEIDTIDNCFNEISDEFIQKYYHDKETAIAQRIIRNLQNENKQLKKVINKARLYVDEHSTFAYRRAERSSFNGELKYVDACKVFLEIQQNCLIF